jgi:multidrug efflux pump subunit AcrB
VVAYRNGSAVRISDIGQAQDSVQDLRNSGDANGKPSVLVIISRQPGANIIDTVDRTASTIFRMALTISTSFVVDDAIVVIENVTRYLEQGMHPFEAALKVRRKSDLPYLRSAFRRLRCSFPCF